MIILISAAEAHAPRTVVWGAVSGRRSGRGPIRSWATVRPGWSRRWDRQRSKLLVAGRRLDVSRSRRWSMEPADVVQRVADTGPRWLVVSCWTVTAYVIQAPQAGFGPARANTPWRIAGCASVQDLVGQLPRKQWLCLQLSEDVNDIGPEVDSPQGPGSGRCPPAAALGSGDPLMAPPICLPRLSVSFGNEAARNEHGK